MLLLVHNCILSILLPLAHGARPARFESKWLDDGILDSSFERRIHESGDSYAHAEDGDSFERMADLDDLDDFFPNCSVTNGSGMSSVYPCMCWTAICDDGQWCNSDQCLAAAAGPLLVAINESGLEAVPIIQRALKVNDTTGVVGEVVRDVLPHAVDKFGEEAAPLIVEAFHDSSASVRSMVVREALPKAIVTLSADMLQLLKESLNDTVAYVRLGAVEKALPAAITKFGASMLPLLREALEDAEVLVVAAAVAVGLTEAIKQTGTQAAPLFDKMLNDTRGPVRHALFGRPLPIAMAKFGTRMIPIIQKCYNDADTNLRDTIASHLEEFVDTFGTRSFPLLKMALQSGDGVIRSQAAGRGLLAVTRNHALSESFGGLDWAVRMFNDSNRRVRDSATDALIVAVTDARGTAEKDREAADQKRIAAELAKACAAKLTKQVRTEIPCFGVDDGAAFVVEVPQGIMLRGAPVQAYRCTNRAACGGPDAEGKGRQWLGSTDGSQAECPLGPSGTNESSLMCREGYDADSPGCSRCSSSYGRSSTDPFACEQCGVPELQRAAAVIVPWGLFTLSIRSISQARRSGDIFNDLLKILQSYGSGASVVLSALAASEAFPELPIEMQSFLSKGDASIQSAVLYSGSPDCLMGYPVGIPETIALSLASPIGIGLGSAAFLAGQRAGGWARRPLSYDAVLVSLVLGNQFLPQIVGASMRGLPCVHMQKDEHGRETDQRLAHSLDIRCDARPVLLYVAAGSMAAIALVCGPFYWWQLLRKKASKAKSPPAGSSDAVVASQVEDPTDFLSANYRDGCVAWEAWVLVRKMALAVNSTLAPMSYSPGQHITQALIILLVSLVAHFYAMPFQKEKRILNVVEGAGITVNTIGMILAMYVSTNIWSATNLARMLATAFAGTLLIAFFCVIIGLIVYARWARSGEIDQVDQGQGDQGGIDQSSGHQAAGTSPGAAARDVPDAARTSSGSPGAS